MNQNIGWNDENDTIEILYLFEITQSLAISAIEP